MASVLTEQLTYIGNRPFKIDNVCGSGITWLGHGDTQNVERRNIPIYLQHPQVWMLKSEYDKQQGGNSLLAPTLAQAAPAVEADEDGAGEATQDEIKAAILQLDDGDPEHFKNGKPAITAVRAVLGKALSVKELNAAWAAISSAPKGH
jgi:hypothetical protein